MRKVLVPLCWLLLFGQPAFGEPAQGPSFFGPCALRHEVVELLETAKEEVLWVGISGDGLLAELWGNEARTTWTFTITSPQGNMCIVHSGAIWGFNPTGTKI